MNDAHVPDLLLEQYRLRELPDGEAPRIENLAKVRADIRARLDELDASDEAIRNSGALDIQLPAARVKRHRAMWLIPAAVIATAIVIAAVLPRSEADGDRVKGLRPALTVYRHTANGSEALADGTVARAGDLLRIGYRPAGHTYGVIFSLDGRGHVTMHLPPSGDRAALLGREPTVLLDQAYELDDAPLWERFYFVTGDRAFETSQVVDAVRRSSALPKGLEQITFSLQKEGRR